MIIRSSARGIADLVAVQPDMKLIADAVSPVQLSVSGAWAKQRAFDIPDEDASETTLDTIIVTAEKRSEPLKDVPMSVTAISGSELTGTESTRFEDYIGKVPGMTLIESSPVCANGSDTVLLPFAAGRKHLQYPSSAFRTGRYRAYRRRCG